MEGAAHNVTKAHVEMIGELIFMEVGKEYHLPHGYVVKNGYEHLKLFQREEEEMGADETTISVPKLKIKEILNISADGLDVKFHLRPRVENEELPRKSYAKHFDYGKINGNVELRHRRSGDYFVIHPDGGKKLLQDYFVEEKVPQEDRDAVWLLCQGSKVIWILGMRNSEDCRIDQNTKYVLEVEFWRN